MTRICLTGATGFIGSALLARLQERPDLEIIALSRKLPPIMDGAKKGNVIWRRCDGFSLIDAENAVAGTDILIYLIHSMMPSSSLTQGSFADFDLYLADNFAKAANKGGVKKVIYLSGLIPNVSNLSDHLKSRLEIEKTLAQYGNNVTTLRSALVVGKNGSSFQILERLSKRLPVSICPSWTQSKAQPIDLQDVVATLEYTIDHSSQLKDCYDIGGPEILSYKDMLIRTAEVLGKKRYIINVPFFSPRLSKLWVSKVASMPKNLVYPLVDSLKHEMVVRPDHQLLLQNHRYIPFTESLKKGLDRESGGWVRAIINYNTNVNFRWLANATSVQRVELKTNLSAATIAKYYFSWIPWYLKPLIQSSLVDDVVEFLLLKRWRLLVLKRSAARSDNSRSVYYVRGGILAREITMNGRLEFRVIESSRCLIIALLNYRPSLPWFIYKFTQAIVHLSAMKKFGRFVRRR